MIQAHPNAARIVRDFQAWAEEADDGYPGPCSDPGGHVWPRVEENERCLCANCGADGDA